MQKHKYKICGQKEKKNALTYYFHKIILTACLTACAWLQADSRTVQVALKWIRKLHQNSVLIA